MLRVAQLYFAAVAVPAGAVLAWASHSAADGTDLRLLALFGAGVVVTELIQVSGDPDASDPKDRHPFSFSSSVHLAAALTLGAAPAALVAAFGVLVVDGLRRPGWRQVVFNASVFALAGTAAGLAYGAVGGTPGQLAFPGDYAPLLALAGAYYLCNTLLITGIIAASSRSSFPPLALDSLRHAVPTAAAETGLGVALALRTLFEPWAVLALAPLVFAVYQAHARLALLRRETARALETFANVVDERDASTFRHSERVAEQMQRLASALGLSAGEAARMRWAGRLHDLGKIAVDTSVLRKPSGLEPGEWEAMRRHPRLSARLLRAFRFAGEEARAVEYHHERYDGRGYYGRDGGSLPLAAHLLIVVDAFDAMTSDRCYRRGLPRETALAEIEKGAGSQFHPAVAKAFVAMERGLDPRVVLDEHDRDLIRRCRTGRERDRIALVRRALRNRPEYAVVGLVAAALVALGLGTATVAAACLVAGLIPLGLRVADGRRAARLRARLLDATRELSPAARLEQVGSFLVERGLCWLGLVAWRHDQLAGSTVFQRAYAGAGLSNDALSSWLLRETEATERLTVAPAWELGHRGEMAVVPLRDGDERTGFLVLLFSGVIPRPVELALSSGGAGLQAIGWPQSSRPSRPTLRAA